MKSRTHAFCVIFALWIFVSPVHGVELGFRVDIQDSVVTDFEAPGLLTGAFLVSNLDTFARDVFEELQLPDNWLLVTKDALFRLGPGQRDVRIVGISVPAKTPPGPYTLTYRVRDLSHPEYGGHRVLHVEVRPIVVIDLSVSHAPQRVEAGSNYSVEYDITHRGNSAAQVDLSAQSSTGFKVRLDSARVNLLPGESRQISVTVSTPRRLLHPAKDRLILQATIVQDTLISGWKAYSTVDVLLGSTSTRNRYRLFPSRFTARYVGGDNVDGMQYEYAGAGFIDERNRYRLEYHYRGPRNFERSVYGVRDEYYLNLQSKDVELSAGDQAFTLSNLLERSRLGRGISGKYKGEGLEAGVIGFHSRPQYQDLEEYGAYIGGRIDRRFAFRGNVLDKKTEQSHDQLFSVSSTVTPNSAWKADLEYAASIRDSSTRETPQAFWGRLDGNLRGFLVSWQKHYAESEFTGYLQDEDQNLVDLYAQLPANFGWVFSFRTLAQNLDRTESKPSAARERHVRTGIRYRNPDLLTGSLDVENHERVDKLSAPDYDNRAVFAAARLQKTYQSLSLSTAIIRGYREDYLTNTTRDHESYRIGIDLRPSSNQNYGLWFQSGHSGYSIDARRSRILGMMLGYRVIPRMRIIANLQARDRDNCGEFESTQYDFSFQYEPLKNHYLLFKIRHLDFDEIQFEHEYSYLLSYEIPFGVPIGRERTLGAVRGRIYETEGDKQAGVPGVVLRLGNQATLSNKKGKFAFHSIEPGTQYLQIDNAGIGLDRLTKQVLPIEIQARGGETETINLEVIGSGSISGGLAVFGFADLSTTRGLLLEQSAGSNGLNENLEMIRLRGLGDTPLTLKSGREVIQTVTDENGRFAVTKLRPGKWTIEVSNYGLPSYHELERTAHEVTLLPNQHEVVELRVVPRVRRLVIADTGTLRLSVDGTTCTQPAHLSIPDSVVSETHALSTEERQTVAVSDIISSDNWFVQAGAFRNKQNAERRAELLRNAGYETRFVPRESAAGTIHQVRVGEFATKQAADSVSAELNKTFSFPTLVITSRRPKDVRVESESQQTLRTNEIKDSPLMDIHTVEDGHWYVQVGAFRNPKNVDRMTERLRQANVRYKLVPSIADNTLMQVRVGGFDVKSDTRSVAARLDSWLDMQTLVIRENYRE